MSKTIAASEIIRVYNRMNENGVVLLRGIDSIITNGDVSDDSRYHRCELDWDEETAGKAAGEFGTYLVDTVLNG